MSSRAGSVRIVDGVRALVLVVVAVRFWWIWRVRGCRCPVEGGIFDRMVEQWHRRTRTLSARLRLPLTAGRLG